MIAAAFWKLVLVVLIVGPQGQPGSYETESFWPSQDECFAMGLMKAREIRQAQAHGHPRILKIAARCEPPSDPEV